MSAPNTVEWISVGNAVATDYPEAASDLDRIIQNAQLALKNCLKFVGTEDMPAFEEAFIPEVEEEIVRIRERIRAGTEPLTRIEDLE